MLSTTLIWFRRNLRLSDNAVLQAALARGLPVAGVWRAESPSECGNPRQARFLYESAAELHGALAAYGIPLYTVQGRAEDELPRLATTLNAAAVLADEAYTPSEILADNRLWHTLDERGIPFIRLNDRAVFAKADLMNEHGRPYQDFLPYRQAWLQAYQQQYAEYRPSESRTLPFQTALAERPPFPERRELHEPQPLAVHRGGVAAAEKQWANFAAEADFYPLLKDFPARKATAHISAYLMAGCLSARALAHNAWQQRHTAWLDALIRRDFYLQRAFHAEDNGMPFESGQANAEFLRRWQAGQTGFPLVDAAMRCLVQSGWLHPALRSAVAGFWCGTLQQPWQAGAAWFAAQLTDYEPAANHGNWQEAATMPVMHPVVSAQKLDPDGTFVRRYLPELAHLPQDFIHTPWLAGSNADTHGYPPPLVSV